MIVQGSEAWIAARLGKATASRIADVMAKVKGGGWSASRANYAAELIIERLTGKPQDNRFQSDAMRDGIEREERARALYGWQTDAEPDECGFIDHPAIPMSGASPDALIAADGVVEFKCPFAAQHLDALLGKPLAAKYATQIQWQLACTGRVWAHWVSYHPDFPPQLRLHIRPVSRDAPAIAEMEREVRAFLAEVDQRERALRALADPGEAFRASVAA